jgi:beta-lactamase superfamily II metal-dependent hydrolase
VFKVEVLPAGHGDSLLVAYGEPDAPHHILIDGGPYYTYNDGAFAKRTTLSKRVQKLIKAGHSLDLLVITHIDADHIEGAVKLLANWPKNLKIEEVWFNAWQHLKQDADDLLGPVQGEMLSALIQKRGLDWNQALSGKAIAVTPDHTLRSVELSGGMKLTLLSPTPVELAALRRTWETELRTAGLDPDSPEAALERLKKDPRLRPDDIDDLLGERRLDVEALAEASFESDASPANGTSIAFIAAFEGKRCLFAGDAHPTVLEASIRQWLHERSESSLRLDAFKLAHHGSKNNLSPELLELVECKRYLVSTNGRYFAHPDEEALARIVVRGGEPVLCFNYRTDKSAAWDDAGLKHDYGYQTVYREERAGCLIVEL